MSNYPYPLVPGVIRQPACEFKHSDKHFHINLVKAVLQKNYNKASNHRNHIQKNLKTTCNSTWKIMRAEQLVPTNAVFDIRTHVAPAGIYTTATPVQPQARFHALRIACNDTVKHPSFPVQCLRTIMIYTTPTSTTFCNWFVFAITFQFLCINLLD